MKLWIDDVRKAPNGYIWCKSVDEAKSVIIQLEKAAIDTNADYCIIDVIDIDHDAGDYYMHGGDYIRLLDWMEFTRRSYPIHIHSMNPVGRENMRAIISRNGWIEV